MKIPALNEFKLKFNDPVWLGVADAILQRHEIGFTELRRAEQGENIVFLSDRSMVLKIYTPQKNGFHRERTALEFADGKMSIPIPEIVEEGELEGYYYLITTQLEGQQMTRSHWLGVDIGQQIKFIEQLAFGLKQLHTHNPAGFDFDWREFLQIQIESAIDKQVREGGNPAWIESMPVFLENNLPLVANQPADAFQHGDVHFGNLRVKQVNGQLQVGGLFDFADSIKGFHEYEFIAIGVLMIQGQGDLQREFFRAYGYKDHEIDETLRRRMMMMTMLYEYSSLRRYAERLGVDPMRYTLEELERAIWNFA